MVGILVYIIASALDCSEYLLRLVPPEFHKTCFKFIFVMLYKYITCWVHILYKYNKYHPGLGSRPRYLSSRHYIARLAAASSHPHRLLPNLENTTYSNSLTNKRVRLYLKT